MNVYDFDNTLLRGDSTARFVGYCLMQYPTVWSDFFGQAINALLFALKLREKQAFKERLLSFLSKIDAETAVEDFWRKNFSRIKPFYAEIQRPDDVVISASPEFLIRPACERLGIRYIIASPVDSRTGKFLGANCHGKEKARRFYEVFPNGRIENFYSDSHSDDPLAAIADHAHLVRGERLLPW